MDTHYRYMTIKQVKLVHPTILQVCKTVFLSWFFRCLKTKQKTTKKKGFTVCLCEIVWLWLSEIFMLLFVAYLYRDLFNFLHLLFSVPPSPSPPWTHFYLAVMFLCLSWFANLFFMFSFFFICLHTHIQQHMLQFLQSIHRSSL